ncbi:MAG: response regulator transcription factor [Roseiflexaceae bacterium]
MSNLTIILADDHHVVRQGLRALLEYSLDCTIVGEASDGQTAIELVQALQPHVLVIDMVLPKQSGIEAIQIIRQVAPNTRIVVLSMHGDESYVREALRAGATAYVLKESDASEFVRAIQHAAEGRRYLGPPLNERALDAYIMQSMETPFDPSETLTSREREVLQLAAMGKTSAEIASQLFLSVRTIETYRTRMMQKLGLRTQVDLVRYALRQGIISIAE